MHLFAAFSGVSGPALTGVLPPAADGWEPTGQGSGLAEQVASLFDVIERIVTVLSYAADAAAVVLVVAVVLGLATVLRALLPVGGRGR